MKKISQQYIFPAVFGLLIYTSIRLVNDSMEETQSWHRSWQQNTIEIIASIALGIIFSNVSTNYTLSKQIFFVCEFLPP